MKFNSLSFLDEIANSGDAAKCLAPGELYVADALLSRSILANEGKLYAEHSDFFATSGGYFDPRDAQIEMGRAVRGLLIAAWAETDPALHINRIADRSVWPHSGCRLLAAIFMPALLCSGRSPALRRALDDIINARMIERTDSGSGGLKARWRKWRLIRAMRREAKIEREGTKNDVLDIVFKHMPETDDNIRAEIYLGFFFSAINSIGVSLSWALLLALEYRQEKAKAEHLVLESLRLFPISVLMERRPAKDHDIGSIRVTPADRVIVSPYVVHHNPRYWPDPDAFLPDRWTKKIDRNAWMPFGAGAHSCIAMAFDIEVMTGLVSAILSASKWTIETCGEQLIPGPALTPPEFVLNRTGHRPAPG